jgi:hypothetical protein
MVAAPSMNEADCLAHQLRRNHSAPNHHTVAGAATA